MKKLIQAVKSRRNMIGNVSWSLIASLISTGVMQLCVYPILAGLHDEAGYGNILFVMGVINVIMLATGNALGDIRITKNAEYEMQGRQGDFNLLLLLNLALSGAVTVVLCVAFDGFLQQRTPAVVITLVLTAMLGTLHAYLVAIFRLRLQFKNGVYMNLIMSVGYLAGLGLSWLTGLWTWPFLLAQASCCAYTGWKTGFYRESFRKTPKCRKTAVDFSSLSLAYLIKSGLTYVDRFLITPLLGAATLSVFTVASTFGKAASVAIQPMANVALGYYSQKNFAMTTRKYWITNGLTLAFGGVFYVAALLLSRPFIAILYPDYTESTGAYIALANISTILTAVTAMIQPAVLKYCAMVWQLLIQLCYGALVTLLSVVFIGRLGLLGFCYGLIIANACKLVFMLLIGDINIRRGVAAKPEQ